MARPRILVSIGTRPEAIKLAPVVHELRRQGWCETRVTAIAQHRDMLDSVLECFDLAVDSDLDLMLVQQPLPDLTSRIVARLGSHLADERPDLVVVQGDTTSAFAMALSCFYLHIPVAHVEAGMRTHTLESPFPEEANRQLIARLAALHFAVTEIGAENLRREGIAPATIAVTGSPVIDALRAIAGRVDPTEFAPPPGRQLVLVTTHRRESFGEPLTRICTALRQLADRGDVEVLYPVHPNPSVHTTVHRLLGAHPSIRLEEPLSYPRFVGAMQAARVILTDSGGVQEEAPSLGTPVLVLRDSTERPEGLAAGTARLVGTNAGEIVAQTSRLLDEAPPRPRADRPANPFGDGHAAGRIAQALRAHLSNR